jgi:GT2 family glycosyltransferase
VTGAEADAPEVDAPEVVIVAYGAPGPLEMCLAALAGAWRPIVVDNSSEPATRAVVETHGGVYVDPGRNLGFGAGVNYALKHRLRPGADVLLLNPDATITPAGIARLQRGLRDNATAACIAPQQVDPADGETAKVWWPIPTPGGAWMEAIGLGSLRKQPGFVIGSVLLLRAAAIEDVGGFDEQFFLYAEETDWEIRALGRGWTIAMCPDVTATHVGAGTGGDPVRRMTHFHASHERLIRKHHGTTGWLVYRAATVAGSLGRVAILHGERRRAAQARLRLYLQGPCRAEQQLT